jgi:DNA-binding response OmpR family regulator
MSRIFVIAHDETFAASIADRLVLIGHETQVEYDGAAAMSALPADQPDLVIVEPTPTRDGDHILRRVRDRLPHAAVLAIGARNTEADVVLGLRSGADDFLARPLRMLEFLARVEALLRRSSYGARRVDPSQDAPRVAARPDPPLEIRGVSIDPDARRALRSGCEIPVSPAEFVVLETLFTRAGRAVSRSDLLQSLGRELRNPLTRAVDQHIAVLRRKLDGGIRDRALIETIRGVGYRIMPD